MFSLLWRLGEFKRVEMGRLLVWVCGSVEGLGGGTAPTAGNGGGHSNTLSSGTLRASCSGRVPIRRVERDVSSKCRPRGVARFVDGSDLLPNLWGGVLSRVFISVADLDLRRVLGRLPSAARVHDHHRWRRAPDPPAVVAQGTDQLTVTMVYEALVLRLPSLWSQIVRKVTT